MPLPVPNLDDRRFDDLVAEARARLATHLPELTQIAPGDPVHHFIDLFAWLTETILYRANLIPERQRRVVLNLLQIPVRTAQPSRGLVCIDSGPRALQLPALVAAGTQLKGGGQSFTTLGELQPTPLSLGVVIKQIVSEEALGEMGLSLQDLQEQYGLAGGDTPLPFQPRAFELGREPLSLADSLDKTYYLALISPKPLQAQIDALRENIAGITLNIAVAPADDADAEAVASLAPRQLQWELMSRDEDGNALLLPLEVIADSSRGARRMGVVRLRLPANAALLQSLLSEDPMFAGVGDAPPELPGPVAGERILAWLRLRCDDEPELPLAYLGINGVDTAGQGRKRDLIVGVGNGRPDQVVNLPDTDIDPDSLELDVEEEGAWVRWQRVDFLLGHDEGARVYRLDASAGYVYFGDGLDGGRRPPAGMRIRVASYLHGGGSATNVAAGDIREIVDGGSQLTLRHEWRFAGGVDAETVDQAERRIPQYLTHRNRAVTREDFRTLALSNPVNPVARAEVLEGFLPGASIQAARDDVPGVVSVFVLPPRQPPALRQTPRPSKGLLKDVFGYLLQRTLVGTELYVLSPEFVPVAIGVMVEVLAPDTEQETLRAVRTALVNFLWPLAPGGVQGEGWPLGATLRPSEVFTQAARVAGVRAVNAVALFQYRSEQKDWRRLGEDEVIALHKFQLPELLGVSVGSGGGEPAFPGGIGPLAGQAGGGSRHVPAPVIPDVC